MKIKSIIAAAALMTVSSAFAATTNITLVQDPLKSTDYTGYFGLSHTGAFTDTFTFSPSLNSSLVSAVLSSIGFTKSTNLDFTSVKINGIALDIVNGAVDTATTPSLLALHGPLTLVVSGQAHDLNPGSFNASITDCP